MCDIIFIKMCGDISEIYQLSEKIKTITKSVISKSLLQKL